MAKKKKHIFRFPLILIQYFHVSHRNFYLPLRSFLSSVVLLLFRINMPTKKRKKKSKNQARTQRNKKEKKIEPN